MEHQAIHNIMNNVIRIYVYYAHLEYSQYTVIHICSTQCALHSEF